MATCKHELSSLQVTGMISVRRRMNVQEMTLRCECGKAWTLKVASTQAKGK